MLKHEYFFIVDELLLRTVTFFFTFVMSNTCKLSLRIDEVCVMVWRLEKWTLVKRNIVFGLTEGVPLVLFICIATLI